MNTLHPGDRRNRTSCAIRGSVSWACRKSFDRAAILIYVVDGLNYGIDFKGGTLIEVRTQGPARSAALRQKLGALGLGEPNSGVRCAPTDVLIRLPNPARRRIPQAIR